MELTCLEGQHCRAFVRDDLIYHLVKIGTLSVIVLIAFESYMASLNPIYELESTSPYWVVVVWVLVDIGACVEVLRNYSRTSKSSNKGVGEGRVRSF